MRQRSPEPTLVTFFPETGYSALGNFLEIDFGTREDREKIGDFIAWLNEHGYDTLSIYVTSLVVETCQFDLMVKRFINDQEAWKHSLKQYRKAFRSFSLVLHEFRVCFADQNGGSLGKSNRKQEDYNPKQEYEEWDEARKSDCYRDVQTLMCVGNIDTFRLGIRASNDAYARRMVPHLMQLTHLLDEELKHQETMVCEVYQLPPRFRQLYFQAIPGHYDEWHYRVTVFLVDLLETLDGLDGPIGRHFDEWHNEWEGKLRSFASRFRTIRDLIVEARQDKLCMSWRDMLQTVPMLGKSRRKPRERLSFLARKEMLNLTGEALEKMEEFKSLYEKLVDQGSSKIVSPASHPDEQGLAQSWAKLWGDVLENQTSDRHLGQMFESDAVKNFTNQQQDGSSQAGGNAAAAEEQQNSRPSLQELADSQDGQPPSMPLSLDQPMMDDHPSSLGETQMPQYRHPRFGEPSVPSTSSRHGSMTGSHEGFSQYSPFSSPFPVRDPNSKLSSWDPPVHTPGADHELREKNARIPFGKTPAPPGPAVTLTSHPYALREHTSKDLRRDIEERPTPTSFPTSFPGQLYRESRAMYGERGSQDRGVLGNMDYLWQGGIPHGAASQRGRAMMQVATRENDDDVEMTDAEGPSHDARMIVDSDSEGSGLGSDPDSEDELDRQVHESSGNSAWESDAVSANEGKVSPGAGGIREKRRGVKRKMPNVKDTIDNGENGPGDGRGGRPSVRAAKRARR